MTTPELKTLAAQLELSSKVSRLLQALEINERELTRLQHTANARTVPTEPPPRNEGRALSVSR